ncbi:GGDEF domain-containing protein [Marinomonas mediterranea]|jgi:PAS domain S-box/diguanylate cyclase (GGDEF) domain|uniref:diguanylate cyclase n=1 Tax=Marinomonas mediterranea (strain ATCC 700492 / JCM 21426 / NBRC 103028 / MMB-1) TaxID=717774 RepID=F2K4Z8_MARM1|nr:GGDEF domain-containing protein [Marinomonas mediterranea]ADZ92641.1 diguanylate cyclase with PAS/PAC sensor [Marinomonas mediterranea MMB-1]WCN10581.1 diguanylate cyclase [Marinomonas mediterranea]WCN14630.1 diguanylate cyclase [Marinomonas mediterranea]WCN18677.1 diguanylate cyclase [Marinomonas mediterranea MMB-1]
MDNSFVVYFSSHLAFCKADIEASLSNHSMLIEWRCIDSIEECPVSNTVLISEGELSGTDVRLLAARRSFVVVENWSLEVSVKWIERGAMNCFSHSTPSLIASYLFSEFTHYTRTESEKVDMSMFQVVIDTIPVPIFYKDHLHIYRGCNDAFCDFLGYSKQKIIGSSVYDIAPKDLAGIYYAADCELLRRGGTQRYEAEVRYANGSLHEIEFNKAVFMRPDGQPGGQVGVMSDITERNQLMRKLEKASATDQLTGAANRRSFDQVIHEEWKVAKASGSPLSLMSLDLDHFKRINDQYGHSAGDTALKLIVDWLQAGLGENDSLYRIGGEEFYVLMKETDLKSALEKAESLRSGLEKHTFMIQDNEIKLTLSIGVIQLGMEIILDQILELIDRALYEAKNNGRNQVRAVSGKRMS